MNRVKIALLCTILLLAPTVRAEKVTVSVDVNAGKPISPDLVGIFFEDLNYAADGGLYAELVQNRSFEYQATEQPAWGPLTSW
jgi:alpha-N-arabinofuranosidase